MKSTLVTENEQCEWAVTANMPGHCINAVSYVDATGKRLCSYHATHLNGRFGVKITPISENVGREIPAQEDATS